MAALGLWRRAPGGRAGSQTSARVSIFPGDDLGGEVHAGGSIDLQSARGAPAGELCRIEIDTLGDRALALELSFRPLGTMEPLVVGGRELRRIDEDDEEEERIQSSRRYQGMPKARTVRSTMGEPRPRRAGRREA
jgi:hypothetical protein